MKDYLLLFTWIAVLGNWPHAYWSIDYVSNVKENFKLFNRWDVSPKNLQNFLICGLISTSIMVLVFLNMHLWAAVGCLVDVIINMYYVYCSYEEKYFSSSANVTAMTRKKRKRLGAYGMGILMPILIYIFAYAYMHVDYEGNFTPGKPADIENVSGN